jgi:hypothetical protein
LNRCITLDFPTDVSHWLVWICPFPSISNSYLPSPQTLRGFLPPRVCMTCYFPNLAHCKHGKFRQHVLPKRWCPSSHVHGVTSQNAIIFYLRQTFRIIDVITVDSCKCCPNICRGPAECQPLHRLLNIVEILSELFMNIPFSAIHLFQLNH